MKKDTQGLDNSKKHSIDAKECKIDTIEHHVQMFLDFCSVEKGLSDGYVKSYQKVLKDFESFMKDKGIATFDQVSRSLFKEFLSCALEKKPSNDAKYRVITAIRTFGRFLGATGVWGQYHLFVNLESPKCVRKLPEILTEEEIARIIEKPFLILLRNWVLLETLYSTGCRISEVCNLRYSDINLDQNTAVVRGKGKKERIVFLTDRTKVGILLLKNAKNNDLAGHNAFVFTRKNDSEKPISRATVVSAIRKYARSSGVLKHVYPHIFRHSFATHLLENGANIIEVKEMLGHSSVSTTQIYTHISLQKIKADHGLLFESHENRRVSREKKRELQSHMKALNKALRGIRRNPLFDKALYKELQKKVNLTRRFIKNNKKKEIG